MGPVYAVRGTSVCEREKAGRLVLVVCTIKASYFVCVGSMPPGSSRLFHLSSSSLQLNGCHVQVLHRRSGENPDKIRKHVICAWCVSRYVGVTLLPKSR